MTADFIQLKGICRYYGRGETEVRALDNVDLTIREGEFVAIMGPSGSGKSTCMNILGCLDTPTAGEYFFRGTNIGKLNRHQQALFRRNFVGFVFQGFNLLKRTTALENIELPLVYRKLDKKTRRQKAIRALNAVGLNGRGTHTSSELSGGQQQRVAIARAIVSDPALFLADEPTGNLDSERSLEIMRLLQRLNREEGRTILMVTHEEDMAAFAERQIHFLDGRLVRDIRTRATAEIV